MHKVSLALVLSMIFSLDAFSYRVAGEDIPKPVFDKDIIWLSSMGVIIESKDLQYEPGYREIHFNICESTYIWSASAIKLVIGKEEDLLAVIDGFNENARNMFNIRVDEKTRLMILIEVNEKIHPFDEIGTFRVFVQ